jgi:anti-sigma-K factor RskA
MIDDATQDQAVQFVLGELDVGASAAFERRLATDAELRQLTYELYETVAKVSTGLGDLEPPPQMISAILRKPSAEAPARPAQGKIIWAQFLPWALAAALAIVCAVLTFRTTTAEQRIADLEHRNLLSQIRIATLQSKLAEYAQTRAVVVWDPQLQRGVAKFSNMPGPGAGRDYQLWVLDPAQPAPVSAGLVRVNNNEVARTDFRPAKSVGSGVKFALSNEPSGGSETPRGEIVFVGE